MATDVMVTAMAMVTAMVMVAMATVRHIPTIIRAAISDGNDRKHICKAKKCGTACNKVVPHFFFALPVSQCLLFSKNHSSAGTMNAAGIYAVA